jgi:hypothetical protein
MKGHNHPGSEKARVGHPDVFISYAAADRKVAQELALRLNERGVSTWLEIENIQSGMDWGRTIRDVIENSGLCMVLISDKTNAPTQWLSKEWATIQESAWRRPDLMVCLVVLDGVEIPVFLRNWQTISLSRKDGNIEKAIDDIIEMFRHKRTRRTAGVSERESSERAARFSEMIDTLTAAQQEASRE